MRSESASEQLEQVLAGATSPDTLAGFVVAAQCVVVPVVPLELFVTTMETLILHPEQQTKAIMRADVLEDTAIDSQPEWSARSDFFTIQRRIRRRLWPSYAQDGTLDQTVLFARSDSGDGFVVMRPNIDASARIPRYHPDVALLAIYYTIDTSANFGKVRIDMKPHFGRNGVEPRSLSAASSILATIRKRLDKQEPYHKRVYHDRIVKKADFQDLRTTLKRKYSWAVHEWREKTQPTKHVHEDVAIAAFLILFWRSMSSQIGHLPSFVDCGCGNGFLTFILVSEGFSGFGFDARPRRSWQLWRERAEKVDLREIVMDARSMIVNDTLSSMIPPGAFLIGNHSDEGVILPCLLSQRRADAVDRLTPWLPLLAAAGRASGMLNLSCCAHDLSGRFTRATYDLPAERWPASHDAKAFEGATLERSGRYAAYVNRIAELTLASGWVPRRELLRIPSTRNAALVAWERHGDQDAALLRVQSLAQHAKEGGTVACKDH